MECLCVRLKVAEKGERNLALAEILNSDEFATLSNFSKEHLCSITINRLYYGIYLLGKAKLLAKDVNTKEKDFLGHGTENVLKKMKNNDNAKNSKCLWVRLKGFYDDNGDWVYKMCLGAIKLHEMRNSYDYCSDVDKERASADLKSCKEQAKWLEGQLRKLQ